MTKVYKQFIEHCNDCPDLDHLCDKNETPHCAPLGRDLKATKEGEIFIPEDCPLEDL